MGCVLYELATLKPPFEAHNVVSLGMKINAGIFPPLPTTFSLLLNKAIRSESFTYIICSHFVILIPLLLTLYYQ